MTLHICTQTEDQFVARKLNSENLQSWTKATSVTINRGDVQEVRFTSTTCSVIVTCLVFNVAFLNFVASIWAHFFQNVRAVYDTI